MRLSLIKLLVSGCHETGCNQPRFKSAYWLNHNEEILSSLGSSIDYLPIIFTFVNLSSWIIIGLYNVFDQKMMSLPNMLSRFIRRSAFLKVITS